jgi:(p)ppGpp synthase/HD superfamily hydrolase
MRFKSYIEINEKMATITDFASRFSEFKHKGQIRKFSGEPYFEHPKRVAEIVKKFKKSHKLDDLIAAAFTHDTLEDTNTTYKDLTTLFGGLVASLVQELTSDKKEIEKIGKTSYLINKMENMSNWALVIKLADRLDNVSDLKTSSKKFRDKMIKSTKEIIRILKNHRKLTPTQQKLTDAIENKIKEAE